MRSFLIKRVLLAIGVVFAISAITFFVLNIVPGDPVRIKVARANLEKKQLDFTIA